MELDSIASFIRECGLFSIDIFDIETQTSWILQLEKDKIKARKKIVIGTMIKVIDIDEKDKERIIEVFNKTKDAIKYVVENCRDIRGVVDIVSRGCNQNTLEDEIAIFEHKLKLLYIKKDTRYKDKMLGYIYITTDTSIDDIIKALSILTIS